MNKMISLFVSFLFFVFFFSCDKKTVKPIKNNKIRPLHDTIGFAQYSWQMDTIYRRFHLKDQKNTKKWKAVICPHDDYKYAGKLYFKSLEGINAKTIILIGVAHRARNFNLQDKLIFGNFSYWKSPYGKIKVASINKEIQQKLPKEDFIVHDSMQVLEHSLEAIIPFLQKKNKQVTIVPILVPYINYKSIDKISDDLSKVLVRILKEHHLTYGKDVAIVISNDAVHYGNTAWGGSNLAPYGVDADGNAKAVLHDKKIIANFLVDSLSMKKIERFTEETVQKEDYKKYKWVWCGRYSVPFGLALANKINIQVNKKSLFGTFLGYQTSIDHPLIKVEDIQMGTTAPANSKHWVGYTSIKYE